MSQRLGKTKKNLVCNLVNVQVSTSRAQYTMHHSTKNDCYYPMAEKKYWKISLGVMVIPWKNIEFSSSEPSAPRKKIQYFSSGLPSPLVIFSNTFFQPQGNTPIPQVVKLIMRVVLGSSQYYTSDYLNHEWYWMILQIWYMGITFQYSNYETN